MREKEKQNIKTYSIINFRAHTQTHIKKMLSHTHTQATKCDGDGNDDAAVNKRARRNNGGGGTAK